MKIAPILILSLTPALLWAQAPVERNPWKSAPPELPEAVKQAKVLSRKVAQPASGTAGRLIVEEIETPLFPAPAPALEVAGPGLSAEERAARRAKEPNELRLFSPTVVVHENGLSLVRWWTADRTTGYQEYTAWVKLDLSSISACGDLSVGRCCYLLMPVMRHAGDRFASKEQIPDLSSFKLPTDIVLTKGDIANKEALEPLRALLEKYDTEGGLIASTAAAQKADLEARIAWEAAHPEAPQDTVIKFWAVGPPPAAK
jgi:hypothetical protein